MNLTLETTFIKMIKPLITRITLISYGDIGEGATTRKTPEPYLPGDEA